MADISSRVTPPPQRVDLSQARDANVGRRAQESFRLRNAQQAQNERPSGGARQVDTRQNEVRQKSARVNEVLQSEARQAERNTQVNTQANTRADAQTSARANAQADTKSYAPLQNQQINSADARRQSIQPTGLAAEERARDRQQSSQLRLDTLPPQQIIQNNTANSQADNPPPRGQIVDILA